MATGSTPVTTDFSLPPMLVYGTYSLTVVANGIASAPVSFTGGTRGPLRRPGRHEQRTHDEPPRGTVSPTVSRSPTTVPTVPRTSS